MKIHLKSNIQLGVVPTHLRFVGTLVPDADGKFPRDAAGAILVVAGMRELCAISPVKFTCVQVSFFPGADPAEIDEVVAGLKALDLEVDFILMVGGVNPMNPADEDAVVAQLVPTLKAAIAHGARTVSSTSIEEWMSTDARRDGAAFEAAIAQNVKVHLRAYEEAGLADSCVESWHIEYLRPGEFKTFTSLERGWAFVSAANRALGRKFFKQLVDAAHCGDSGVSMADNAALIARIAAAGELGIFHASAKTTRGCLSTDDGWIGALLTAMAQTGELRQVFVELFDHEDPALEPLRALEPGHGIDTRDGRSYNEVVADGLAETARRLNNLAARGILKG
ncbi:MAG: hypothetical protein K9N23_18725 [Akkermansiaceae bacterium]|nr:hypothetical protein [Akkermansiaceae bacterium]MCF7733730.1 hypothetical protein [Akkermansiaceae bacterium]